MSTPLRLARQQRGIAAEDLAHEVGVRQSTINRIENGKKRPSPELAIRIVEFFGDELTRDQVIFPEFYPASSAKKPAQSARA